MLAAQAILPIFALIVLGYLLGWRQWLTSESAAGLANITFKLFMPTLLFTGIAKAHLAEGLSPMLLLGYYLPVLLVFVLVNAVAHWRRGAATPLGLVAAFSNNVLVGIPLILAPLLAILFLRPYLDKHPAIRPLTAAAPASAACSRKYRAKSPPISRTASRPDPAVPAS